MRLRLTAIILTVIASIASPSDAAETRKGKPNIIMFVIDDLGFADMSFLEDAPADIKAMNTPNIDKLRNMGTYFTQAYATAPICSPSRTGLITGRYQQRWGNFWYNEGGLPKTEKTIPQSLKELGYVTRKVGKCHHNGGPAEFPTKHGFDEFLGFTFHTWDYMRLSEKDVKAYGKKGAKSASIGPLILAGGSRQKEVSFENGFTTEVFTDDAVEYIKRDHGGKPFYLQMDYNAVHMPTYVVPPKYAERVGFKTSAWDRNAPREFPFWNPKKEGWRSWHKKWGHLGAVDPNGRKRYLAQLLALDDGIGKILKTLEDRGIIKNTVLVFISDNGGTINTYSNNGKLRGYKYMFGEGGIRVPLIISGPGLPAGKTVTQVVSAMDVMPTLLELCGAPVPGNLDGKTLLPLLKGESDASPHDHLCWSDGNSAKVVRQGNHKLVMGAGWIHANFKLEDGRAVRAPDYTYPDSVCLFNLEKDVGERTNLADKMPERVAAMKKLYDEWIAAMRLPRGKHKGMNKGKQH